MIPRFVFGTLRHAGLRAIVAGEDPATRPASLKGHDVCAVKDAAFPMLVANEDAQADGLVLEGLSEEAMARIDFYEGIFRYRRVPVEVATDDGAVAAEVYLPPEEGLIPDGPWDFDGWITHHAALNMVAAEEVMERRGINSPEELATLYPFIRARGWSHLRARQTPAPTTLRHHARPGDVVVGAHDAPHDGFFRLKRFDVQARRFQGQMSDPVGRECFVGYDAALVLPYDPLSDRVLVVEQLRYGPLWRGDPQPWTLEPIAGMIDAGEAPETTARREALEEAGLALETLLPIAGVYPAPGYVTEYYHCFLGLGPLDPAQAGIAGLASENENIRSHILDFDHAMALVDSGEINIAPLVMMLLWLSRHRAHLRADATGGAAT